MVNGERSPSSVMGGLPEKEFPQLPAGAAPTDDALHQYKVVNGPAWYSDS